MFGMQILDVVIGLTFIYLLLALICTALNELIAGKMDSRAKNLGKGIENLLSGNHLIQDGAGLINLFNNHPLIKSLKEDGTTPSYIPPRTFALALLDVVASQGKGDTQSTANLRQAADKALRDGSDVKKTLVLFLDQAGDDMQKLIAHLETWFNDSMDRISAWYKQKTQWVIVALALFVTVITGADTIQIAKSLMNDPAIRNAVVNQAREAVKNMPDDISTGHGKAVEKAGAKTNEEILSKDISTLNNLGLKLGWKGEPSDGWPRKIIGLLVTTLAVSVGAPFWFDLLNKFISIRAVGKSPDEKEKAKPR